MLEMYKKLIDDLMLTNFEKLNTSDLVKLFDGYGYPDVVDANEVITVNQAADHMQLARVKYLLEAILKGKLNLHKLFAFNIVEFYNAADYYKSIRDAQVCNG